MSAPPCGPGSDRPAGHLQAAGSAAAAVPPRCCRQAYACCTAGSWCGRTCLASMHCEIINTGQHDGQMQVNARQTQDGAPRSWPCTGAVHPESNWLARGNLQVHGAEERRCSTTSGAVPVPSSHSCLRCGRRSSVPSKSSSVTSSRGLASSWRSAPAPASTGGTASSWLPLSTKSLRPAAGQCTGDRHGHHTCQAATATQPTDKLPHACSDASPATGRASGRPRSLHPRMLSLARAASGAASSPELRSQSHTPISRRSGICAVARRITCAKLLLPSRASDALQRRRSRRVTTPSTLPPPSKAAGCRAQPSMRSATAGCLAVSSRHAGLGSEEGAAERHKRGRRAGWAAAVRGRLQAAEACAGAIQGGAGNLQQAAQQGLPQRLQHTPAAAAAAYSGSVDPAACRCSLERWHSWSQGCAAPTRVEA